MSASPKTTYSLDGVSYDWIGYQTMLIDKMDALRLQIQREDGPFMVFSRGIT